MQFSEIVGQQEVKHHLIQSVLENRVSHAQLFLSPEGSGGLPLALAYAQYISCENRQPDDSCGECSSCRKYNRLIHPDLHFSYPFFAKHKDDTASTFMEEWREAFLNNPYLGLDEWRNQVDAENKQANINIAECHAIIKKLSMTQFEAEYKVLIMWLPEYLDKAGNALLKLIEEPPHKTLFLLVSQNQDQILNTILSRTQLIKINRLSDNDITEFLINKKGLSAEMAARASYLSEGNIQIAITLGLDEANNNFGIFSEWLRTCFANRGIQAIEFAESTLKMGRENQKNLLKYGMKLLREVTMELSGASNLIHLPGNEKEFVVNFSKALSLEKAEALINELEKAHYHIERNANPKILFLDVSLQFIKILKFNTLPSGTQHIYN